MRRVLLIIALALLAAVGVLSLGAAGEDDSYLVRAVFDNGGFVVEGEDVKVAGARVGSVESVDVAMPGELVSKGEGGLQEAPGKAIVVLKIDDPAFEDFRQDASCQIRAQSLIGEKFIDCRPTLPRAPGSPAPPPLEVIEDDQPGTGQRLLPLEQNGSIVDPDLVNNIFRRPYAERFRLLLNELGAGFAARGEDLAEIIRRANPTLRDTDRLLAILAAQRRQLAQLAGDSDTILRPLARERRHLSGFITNAGVAAEATAERGDELEASFQRLPGFLAELRSTMASLQGFSEGAEPVMADLNRAAEDLTVATKRLKPFLGNSIPALRTLGTAGEEVGPDLVAAQPTLERVKRFAQTGARPLANGAEFLTSLRQRHGFERLMDLIYNTTASVNGFDSYGHLLRSVVQPTNCVDYSPLNFTGCNAKWKPAEKKKKKKKKKKKGAAKSAAAPRGAPAVAGFSPSAEPQAPPTPQPDRRPETLLDFLFGR